MFPELELREGWVTVICLLLMSLCVAWAYQTAQWVEGMAILQAAVLLGSLLVFLATATATAMTTTLVLSLGVGLSR